MCLALVALGVHSEYPLIVAANRDEFYDRATAPAGFWAEAPGVLGGRDLRAGGTWLGIDRRGRFAAVTNFRQGTREPPRGRSRGALVADYLMTAVSAEAHIARVGLDADQYNGFNLLAGDFRQMHYYSNREGRAQVLSRGVFGLSNHLLDTAWPKVSSAKQALGALLASEGSALTAGLLDLLSDRRRPADELLPSTGVGIELERLLSSAFIASPEYGTRSSTVVLVSRSGDVVFLERTFGPGGKPEGEVRHEFRISTTVSAI